MASQADEANQTILYLGKKHYAERNYEEALKYLKDFTQDHTRFADVWFMVGVCHHSLGRFSEAIEAFENALSINPHYMEAALNLAVTYNDVGQYEKGAKTYAQAMEAAREGGHDDLDPIVLARLANQHADLGDLYRSVGRPADAIEQYAKAVELRPKFVDIQTKLGMALREAGDLHESIRQFKQAMQTNPNYLAAKVHLGISLFAAGNYSDALSLWEEVLGKAPEHKEALLYKAMAEKKLAGK